MKTSDVLIWGAVAVGGYLGYRYVLEPWLGSSGGASPDSTVPPPPGASEGSSAPPPGAGGSPTPPPAKVVAPPPGAPAGSPAGSPAVVANDFQTRVIQALIAAGVSPAALMTCDQWNFYGNKTVDPAKGPLPDPLNGCIPRPAPLYVPDRNATLPFAQWMTWVQSQGRGLGQMPTGWVDSRYQVS